MHVRTCARPALAADVMESRRIRTEYAVLRSSRRLCASLCVRTHDRKCKEAGASLRNSAQVLCKKHAGSVKLRYYARADRLTGSMCNLSYAPTPAWLQCQGGRSPSLISARCQHRCHSRGQLISATGPHTTCCIAVPAARATDGPLATLCMPAASSALAFDVVIVMRSSDD